MGKKRVSKLRKRVERRAGGRCEYGNVEGASLALRSGRDLAKLVKPKQ